MSGLHLLIAAIIIVFVAAFIITMLVVNANAKKIIGTNSKLVQNQNMLVEQNKQQGREIEALQKQQEELAEKLKHAIPDKEMQLRQQIQEHREHIERTADMTDDELLAWVDLQMEEKKLYTDTDLSLKTMAKARKLKSGAWQTRATKVINGQKVTKSFTINPKQTLGDSRKAKLQSELHFRMSQLRLIHCL